MKTLKVRVAELIASLEENVEQEIHNFNEANNNLGAACFNLAEEAKPHYRKNRSLAYTKGRAYLEVLSKVYESFPEVTTPEKAAIKLDVYNHFDQFSELMEEQ